jgi:hypothetical protein
MLAVLCTASSLHAMADGDVIPAVPVTSELSLEQLSRRAGIIFAGTVVRVEVPEKAESPEISRFVQVTFRVDDGIRNANSGELITIREWAGLWRTGSGERYRLGEKLLMFYYPPNGSGTTSSVAGSAGRFTINAQDQIHVTTERKQSLFRAARLRGFEQDANLNLADVREGVPYNTVAPALRLIAADSQ